MKQILANRKITAWLILLTFLFTSILPINADTAWAATSASADGVSVKVFNYNTSANDTALGESGYNFFQGAYGNTNNSNNSVDGIWGATEMAAMHGTDANYNKNNKLVMSKVLGTDGYPQTSANQSLNYLFNGTYQKASLANGGGLFQKDSQGYYYYDSAVNAASLRSNGFELHDYAVRPAYVDTSNITDVRMGNFLPFNNNSNVIFDTTNLSTVAARSAKLNELVDCWFGLNVEFDFLMPKNGQLNGEDMIFDFHGDDDVWVYIDDVLVLDIGGTHAAESATINFHTGMATDPNGNASGKTLRQIFAASGKYTEAQMTAMFGSGNTFVDYSQHNLKFFYMERGGNISFCRLRFNLITLPETSLTVTKEVEMEKDNATTQADIDYVKNMPYKFRVVDANDTSKLFIPAGTSYKIFKNGVDTQTTGAVDSNGFFYLKDGESAQFTDLLKQENGSGKPENYIVQEFIPDELTGQYSGVDVEYKHTLLKGEIETANKQQGFTAYDTPALSTGDTQAVTYRNRIDVSKLSKLAITKSIKDKETSTFAENQEFTVEVTLNDELLPTGTEYTVKKQGETTERTRKSEANGIIRLKADETATIPNIVAGTTYKVKEVNVDANCNVVYKDSNSNTITLSNGYVTGSFGAVNTTIALEVENESLTTKRTVTKVWDDDDNRDGIRPTELKVTLKNGSEVVATVILNEGNDWTATVENLPKYANNQEISYKWTEDTLPEGYRLTETKTDGAITTLTNKHDPATRTITLVKRWVVPPGEKVTLPVSGAITVTLMKDNVAVPNSDVAGELDGVKTLTWSSTTNITDVQGGITGVELYSEQIEWEVPFNENGKELPLDAWDVVENLGENYGHLYTINETRTVNDQNLTITLTNTYDPIHRSLVVNKIWNDYGNRHNTRPDSVDVQLWFSLDEGETWKVVPENQYPIMPYSTAVLDVSDEASIKTFFSAVPGIVTLTESGAIPWGYIWNNLPQYHNNDNDSPERESIIYKVTEVTYDDEGKWILSGGSDEHGGYDGKLDGDNDPDPNEVIEGKKVNKNSWAYTITNYHEPAVEISGTKVWKDNNNQDGKRPASITLNLLADGKPVLNDENKPVQTTATENDSWSWKFPKQLMYNKNGKAIVYTVTEDAVDGYTTQITSQSAYTFEITNTHEIEKVNQTVKKVWDDADNQDGKRPQEIEVSLLADGNPVKDAGNQDITVTLNEANKWTATVKDLPKFKEGEEIVYTWEEKELPEDYTLTSTSVDGTVTTLTNSYKPETISLTVEKIWDDDDDDAKQRPGILEMTLSDGIAATQDLEVTLNADNRWKVTVTDLPVYANGKEIRYTWIEAGMPAGYVQTNYDNRDMTHVIVTNTYNPNYIEISGEKFWQDVNGNALDNHPDKITVNLFQNDVEIADVEVTTASAWKYEFKNLPRVDSNGNEYKYTITEDAVPGYQAAIVKVAGGFNIINRMVIGEAGQIQVRKNVEGNKKPADGVYRFELNVESNIEKWDALEVWEKLQLENSWKQAKQDRDDAKTAWENAKTEFSKNAVQLNTSPSGIQFSMASEVTSSSSIKFFEYQMIDKDGYLHNTTSSAYGFDMAAATTDTNVVERIILAIQKVAGKLNEANRAFLIALQHEINDVAYALGFKQTDAQRLMDTADTLFDAEALVTSTQLAFESYKPERSTPSAMTLIVKDGSGKEVDRINAVGQYEYQFNLKHDETYSFDVETTTGSVIRYKIKEIDYPTSNYSGTEISLNGDEKTKISGTDSGEYVLNKNNEYDFLFTNYYNGTGTQGGDTPVSDSITRTVTKVWKGDIVNDRPDFIEVEITADGVVDRTVKLNAANNWTYSWTEKNDGILWRVREINVPEGYTSTMSVEDNRYWTITNTLDSSIPEKDPDPKPEDDPDNPTDNPDENDKPGPVEPGTPVEPEPDLGDAPDTGDHSHAVPFAVLMLIAMAGLVITRRKFN